MQFMKMHGAGNDFIVIDCIRNTVPEHLDAYQL